MRKNDYNKNNLEEINAYIHERIYLKPICATSDEDIAIAVFNGLRDSNPSFKENVLSKQLYIWNCNSYTVEYTGTKYNYGGNTGNNGYGLWFWHNRFNQPYQHDIEEHVRKWKRPVPKYSSDISLAMAVAEKMELFDTIILDKTKGENTWFTFRKLDSKNQKYNPVSMGYTAAEAIARACLVLKAEKDEQSSRSDQYDFSGIA